MVGKSFVISQIYNYLEKKYTTSNKILNGCHWFNCDVGIFGSPNGKKIIDEYINILKILKNKNTIFEKFHLTDQVYNKLYNSKKINYQTQEKELKKLNAKIILLTVKNKKVFEDRIPDRLNNVPHYKHILQKSKKYWNQQEEYLNLIKKTKLDYLVVDSTELLNKKFVKNLV